MPTARLALRLVVILALLGAVLPMWAAPGATPSSGLPYLPGILGADERPHGCVDCHVLGADGKDNRLNRMIAGIASHPSVGTAFKNATIPDACLLCHKRGSKLGSLTAIIHKVHYEGRTQSYFVTNYQGSCLNCHSLDLSTGVMNVKNGPANW